ncbi:MAG TPA: DUF4037 domain-containing protein [Spirochaetia bacterium]
MHKIAGGLADRLSRVHGVQAVLLGEAADIEVFDPYFTIDLDVYVAESPPSIEKRAKLYPDIEAFETSPVTTLDRFLVEKLPTSVHYIRSDDVDRMLLRISEMSWVFHEPGTNALYRIEHGDVLYAAGTWLEEARAALAHVPSQFWLQTRLRAFALAERALSDLGAAAHRSDSLFFLVSASRFIRCVTSFVFAVNHRYEPSDRMLAERIASLELLPDGFSGQLDSFLRPIGEVSMVARREIAEHILRSLMPFTLEDRE